VELTEGSVMQNVEASILLLGEIKALGVRLSIDDFGTGYSSLSYLKRFPLDHLKIDQSFVRDVTTDPAAAAVTAAIIVMAHGLKLGVVAEGVETRASWDRLAALGCDAAQGYYLSRPLPAADLTRWLAESPWGL
jgi:EAL domain-containing protein (putative c-di-GMP-specific phosphodiesterase class I)